MERVVLRHLDWDHGNNFELFAESTDVVVQREELSYAADPYPPHAVRYGATSAGVVREWRSRDLRPVDGEVELLEE